MIKKLLLVTFCFAFLLKSDAQIPKSPIHIPMSPAQISDGPTSIRIYCGPPKHHGNPLVFIDSFETDFKSLVLDPNNIESINVLKDTVATRLYGARAKHGVILIKTKLNTKFYKVTDFVNPRVNLNSSVSAIELNGILLSDFKTIIIG